MADSVEVLDHRNAGLFHETRDQPFAATGNHDINPLRVSDQLIHHIAVRGCHKLHRVSRQSGFFKRFRDNFRENPVRPDRFAAAAENGGVAALQRERRGIHCDIRAAFINDRDHAKRHAHAANQNAGGLGFERLNSADGIRKLRDLSAAFRHLLHRVFSHREAVDKSVRVTLQLRCLKVFTVDGLDFFRPLEEKARKHGKRLVLRRPAGCRHRFRRGAGTGPKVPHIVERGAARFVFCHFRHVFLTFARKYPGGGVTVRPDVRGRRGSGYRAMKAATDFSSTQGSVSREGTGIPL